MVLTIALISFALGFLFGKLRSESQIRAVLKKYNIPNLTELDGQLADAQVLYDVLQKKAPLSTLVSVIMQESGWTVESKRVAAHDILEALNSEELVSPPA